MSDDRSTFSDSRFAYGGAASPDHTVEPSVVQVLALAAQAMHREDCNPASINCLSLAMDTELLCQQDRDALMLLVMGFFYSLLEMASQSKLDSGDHAFIEAIMNRAQLVEDLEATSRHAIDGGLTTLPLEFDEVVELTGGTAMDDADGVAH